jgi:hypothetical protein
MAVAAAWLFAASGIAAQTPAQPAAFCGIAEDAGYGYTREQPVQVGGGAMFVASRERRYLDALRGPAGEPVRYKRTGSTSVEVNSLTILDAYEVNHDGLEKPVTIYLDAYHYDDELRAPKGFTCGAPIGLAPPGPDLFQASRFLLQIAVEQGSSRDFAPIPLAPPAGGQPGRGIVLDHFRMMAIVARAASAAGQPIALNPAVRPPDSLRQRTVVVAYPIDCEGRMIPARSIDLVSAQGLAAPRQGEYANGDALAALLPGLQTPAGSVAATFGLQAPRPNDAVRIAYGEPCAPGSEVTIPLHYTPARAATTPAPALPEGVTATPAAIRVQAQVDLDGALHHVTYVGGPRQLLKSAIDAVKAWTFEPARINGAAISTPVAVQVRFTAR